MDSHFSLDYSQQDKLIDFLNQYYSLEDLYSLCRLLELNKDDIMTQYVPKRINCERFVEVIKQREYYYRLFLLLQTEKFYRETLIVYFPNVNITKPKKTPELEELGRKVYSSSSIGNEGQVTHEIWIEQCKKSTVLILGKDSPDEYMKELEEIGKVVQERGYNPIFIKKQAEVDISSNEEKMLTYASLSRFIIIEKSYAAGQIDEAKICAINRFPAIWLRREGHGDTWMQGDYEADFKFIKNFCYDENNKNDVIKSAIEWVEEFIDTKREYLNNIYPWR
ncbi:hypothetical protein A8990_11497 [Paenibacillus taihuensis]|uniref:Uncharacterized protein n=1 Tax=Paenibacillus taihuensis TaxID=1156355 RepID=A0A3D9S7Q0_9BACL|nr:hypothetical protein [Paenibacillus taihuensis]REE84562.1 hypothetical protein A8990_11497 [Paenibacillus taihuensis]